MVQIIHCGYRCSDPTRLRRSRLYRSAQAEALARPGFTFRLDVVILVGRKRLEEHEKLLDLSRSAVSQPRITDNLLCLR